VGTDPEDAVMRQPNTLVKNISYGIVTLIDNPDIFIGSTII